MRWKRAQTEPQVSLADVINNRNGQTFPRSVEEITDRTQLTLHPRLNLTPGMSIFAIGSCFARNIEEALANCGFTIPTLRFAVPQSEWPGPRSRGILNRYTTPSILQLIRWVVDGMDAPPRHSRTTETYWLETDDGIGVDMDLCGLIPVTKRRFLERRHEIFEVCQQLATADACVITLGQTESFKLRSRGLHFGAAPVNLDLRSYWSDTFRIVADHRSIVHDMTDSINLIRRVNPSCRVILSVSPVPATRYWYPESGLRAYWISKFALWSAAQEISATLDEVHYFPSFEAVHLSDEVWEADRVHVRDATVQRIVSAFIDANVALNN